MQGESFEWHTDKDALNRTAHGVSFAEAQHAFLDPQRIIAVDRTTVNTSNAIFVLDAFATAY